MSYHHRLSNESRRAQDREPDDGAGLLLWGLAVIAVLLLIAWVLL